jgi:multiple sugar transport system substrate-binding protein
MTMRRLYAVVLTLLITGWAPGCAKRDSDSAIRFWQFWDIRIVEPMVRHFEAAHPGIKVEIEQLTWKSGLEKIQAAIASGTEPDLCELGSTWLPRFSYEGVLSDLSGAYAAVADSFIMWESAMWEGKVYALPWVQGSRVLFYNADLFRRAGLDPDRPPETWDDLLKAAWRIDQLADDVKGFGLNMGERYILYKKFMAFAWGNGGGIIDSSGAVIFNSNENLEALEFYQALAQYSLKEKQEVLDQYFKTGKLGMQISGAWNIRNYAAEAPGLEYRVALVPRPSSARGHHASFAGAEMLVIFEKSKRKADALKLARFLQDYPQAKQLCLAAGSVFPASKHAVDDVTFTRDDRMRVFVEQAMTSHTAPAHPGWIDMEDVINRAIETVMYGKAEPRRSLEVAARDLEEIVQRFQR